MKKLILGCLLALFASGCNDNEPEQKPVELKISFAGENPVEFTVGEQKRLAFTVTGDDLEGLTFAAEPDEALSGWTVVVSAGREGDAYAGALDVTASATPSETAVTLTVTDRNGKPWSATTPTLTAVQAPVTAIDLSRDGTANCYIVSEAGDYMFDATVRGNGSGDDAAIALADGMKADWLWVTKGLEQEIRPFRSMPEKAASSLRRQAPRRAMPSSRLRMPRGRSCGAGISGSRRNLGW